MQGVYVLTDNQFRPFQRMSTEAGGQAVVRAQPVCIVGVNDWFEIVESNLTTTVPLVSMWDSARRPRGHGNQCHSTSGDA
jgi:hypothetical protein